MRTHFLGLTAAALMCACGGSDFTITDAGGGDGNGGDGGGGDGGGGGDAGMDSGACLPMEICGNGVDDNCNMQVDEGCNGIGTFVSGATGSDMNPGTKVSPVKTIAKGIANAQTLGGTRTVYVAGSHYPEKVTMIEGISLEGGYLCDMNSCTWALNPIMNDTAILNPDFEGVVAPATITRATHISGFRIQGMNGAPSANPGSVALSIKGSPTVSANRINGGDVNGGSFQRTSAIAVLAPIADPNGPLIENNDIKGGASNANSMGLLFDWAPNPPANSTSTALVRSNRIVGGTAVGNTYGVLAWSTAGNAALVGNAITAGTSTANGNLAGAWGVGVGGTLLVDSNLINVDQNAVGKCAQPQAWCGGLVSLSSTSVITNNVIYGVSGPRSAAVLLTEAEKAAGVVTLNGNTLDGAGMGLTANPTLSTAVALRIVVGVNGVFGKIRNDILQGGQNLNRYGIYEEQVPNKTNKPQALEYDDFFFPALQGRNNVFWHQWDGTTASDITMTPSGNNLNVDPTLDNTWHLKQGSGCIDKGTATEAPAKDRDGDNRPNNNVVDIGADEFK
jgi:hypothetical protein